MSFNFDRDMIETFPLTDLLTFIVDNRGKSAPTEEIGIPLIATNCIKNTELYPTYEKVRYVSKETYENWFRAHPKPGDIIFVNKGGPGNVVLVPDVVDFCIAQDMMAFRVDNKKVYNKYLFAVLRSPQIQSKIRNYHVGTMIPHFKKGDLNQLEIPVPIRSVQEYIGDIYFNLSYKIEVNNKINKTLEEMAQAIFKHWFVDFEFPNEEGEPYKSSGGEMIDSELGPIPKGWEVGIIGDYITKTKGGDWGKERPEGNYLAKVKCIRGADIDDLPSGRKGNVPTRYILEKNYVSKKLVNGNLIVEISGGSPTQSTGRIAYISEEIIKRNADPLICTNFCRAIVLEDPDLMFFVFNYWRYLYSGNVFFNYENGTTGIKNLDINSFLEGYLIIKPTKEVVRIYADIISDFDRMIQNNGISNEVLSSIRDTLLPKLMSGEIRVPIDNEE